MSQAENYYGKASEFAYPFPLDQASIERIARDPYESLKTKNEYVFTPTNALLAWFRTEFGQYQSRQACRYPELHRNLPIPEETGIHPHSNEAVELKKQVLELVANYAGLNIHPIGHMAVVLSNTQELLEVGQMNGALTYQRELDDTMRHAAALHGIAHVVHPNPDAVNGKIINTLQIDQTVEPDKPLEKIVLRNILNSMFGHAYPPEKCDLMVRLIQHNIESTNKLTRTYHAVSQIAHELGDRSTAMALIRAAESAYIAPTWITRALLTTASNIEKTTSQNLKEAIKEAPFFREYIIQEAQALEELVK